MIKGTVVYLSADALAGADARPTKAEQNARTDFYIVRVRLEEADTRQQMGRFRPNPGMPADVYIKTGERTFFDYIMRPLLDSFSRAFRES